MYPEGMGDLLMYYEQSVIDEVRSRSDIVRVVGARVKLKKAGSNYSGLCPFHNEKTPSFIVSPNRQTYKCFGCGKGGNSITFVMEYENMTFPEALHFLAEENGITLPERETTGEELREASLKKRLGELYRFAATYYYKMLRSPAGTHALEYLKNRKLSDETIRNFGLGFSDGSLYRALKEEGYQDDLLSKSGLFTYTERDGVNDKFWNRVMFPIMDSNSKVIAFGGRVMGDALPKYLNSPETPIFEKNRHLYGMHVARRTREPFFLLCEGYMDTISLHQAGFNNAVASLGTALTPLQAQLLSRYTKVVRITYDSDGAGQKAANRAIPILRSCGIRSYVVNMEPYKDPDEFIKALGAEEYRKRVENAVPGFRFELQYLAKDYDLGEPEQKSEFLKQAAMKMTVFEDPVERGTYMDSFCASYNVEREAFRQLVNRLGKTAEMNERTQELKETDRKDMENRKTAETNHKPEEIVISILVEKPALFGALSDILSAEDFEEGIGRDIFAKCENAFRQSGSISPAGIISAYETVEEQNTAAAYLDTGCRLPEETEDRHKAFSDAVFRIKEKALGREAAGTLADPFAFAKKKKELLSLRSVLGRRLSQL